ncbi:MBL fold metallo-hydrolase [uncultured Methanospirillum sp.]|uniref:MBL fold metallo-hydrolase n=1 Tax=uncultured Methanospirillum sp. TaxID=262503 RepID=UPI0029C68909|nr:MBL fold metallo-hydrolase [uncultured Methanospirillum sp.]
MIIREFFIPGIAHSSFLVGGAGSCLIVDPSRDIDRYLEAAREEGLKIAGVLETHLHADFISGHLEFAHKTGAPIYMPERAKAVFPHIPVRQGSVITIGDMRIEVRETPGHTPEHVSYVLVHQSRSESPALVFCGDTLFVGDAGRPDLFPGRANELASALYTSLHEELMTLPDHCEVYPAHSAGSFCGRSLSTKKSSTIGYERIANPVLAIQDRETFTTTLTTNMPPAPDHFNRCSEVNRRGPVLLSELPVLKALSLGDVRNMLESGDTEVVDIRMYDAFGGVHIPGSLNIDAEVNFSTYAGWITSPDMNQVLVGYNPDQITDAVLMMHRVGIDSIAGYLSGGIQNWALSGLKTEQIRIISVHELARLIAGESELMILDVRPTAEYAGYHIPGSINIPWPDLRTRQSEVSSSGLVAVICGSGVRAGTACSILKRAGHHNIMNIAGGYTGWIAAGFDKPLQ